MKSLLTVMILSAAIAFAQTSTPAAPAVSDPTATENSRKAKALLDKMIEALGGQAYLGIHDISAQGRGYTFINGRPNSYGVQFWQFYKFPDKERMELTKKRDVVFLHIGEEGYEITFKGAKKEDPKRLAEYVRDIHYALDRVLRIWLQEPGVALFYEGTAEAADKPAEKVSILNAKNEGVTIYISTTTFLPLKKSFTWRNTEYKELDTKDTLYDNYRNVQGVMIPFTITTYTNNLISGQRFLNSVELNQNLDDSLFQPVSLSAPKK